MKVRHLSGTLNLGILVIQMLRNATTFGNNNIHYDTKQFTGFSKEEMIMLNVEN